MAKESKTAEAVVMSAFRLKPELLKRLDQHAKRMEAASPGLTFTRSDAVRALLTQGLDVAERKDKR